MNQKPSQNQKQQPKPKNYLKFSDKELKKLEEHKSRSSGTEVDQEWAEIAEFGYYYGFEGIQAILNNQIDIDVVQMLLAGSRIVWARQALDIAQASFAASVSAQSKKPSATFKKAIKGFIDRMKVEN